MTTLEGRHVRSRVRRPYLLRVQTLEEPRRLFPVPSLLIVDDSAQWRARVRGLLEEHPELRIVAEACDGSQGVSIAEELQPDLVLLDIGMPVLNGLDAARQIRRSSPGSKIVFLTQENDPDIRSAALATGADGYVLKTNAASELLPTIAVVLRNGDQPH